MADRSGQQLGNYRLNKLLGKGGFGAVYHATHVLLDREQAVKVLLEDHLSDPKALDRFLREAKTLAKLDHPNIVHVDELSMDGSVVYLVMPFLSGGTLQEMLRQRTSPLSLEEIRRILEQVCPALDFAHGQGVVHLDLKPLNLLRHQDGRWLLSDFGLAHLMQTGALIGGTSLSFGTPHYMAPEHVLGNPERRSDLYALGCMLYQLLTGHLPFEAAVGQAIMFKHVSDPPPKLSGYRAELPAALEGAMAKALAKKPDERYQTAGELLAAFRAAVGSQRAPSLQPAALPPTQYVMPQPAPLPPTIAAKAPPIMDRPSPAPGTHLFTLEGHTSSVNAVAWSPDGSRLASASGDGTVRLWDAASRKLLATLKGHTSSVNAVAWSSDGRCLASGSTDWTVRLWDATTGQSLTTLKGHTSSVYAIAWSPIGRFLASTSDDRTVRLWEGSGGWPIVALTDHTKAVNAVAWSPDGRRLASASADQKVRLWDATTGQPLATFTGHTSSVNAVAWSPDGRRFASASSDNTVRLWSAGPFATLKDHTSSVNAVAWSPDGRHLASASADQTIRIWNASGSQPLSILKGHSQVVRSVSWSPDSHRLASGSEDGTVRVWGIS